MRQARVYRYCIPMEAGVILRNQRLKSREGLLVCLSQQGQTGWGEIAPLPGFSQETLEQAAEQTRQLLVDWLAGEDKLPEALPSVAFGLSCALAELHNQLPLAADYRAAPLCYGDPDELYAKINAMPGEKLAKVKVGLYEAVADGLNVSMLLEAIPALHLRLDANRSWTPEKAAAFARYLPQSARARIAFLEEPCRTPQQSLDFAAQTGIAIAWDERLREADFQVQAEPGVKAIIIKPTLIGSLDKCRGLVTQAQQCGLTAVISSSLESSLGLTQLARVAAWLTPEVVPGLDTLDLMQAQLLRAWPQSALPLITADQLEVAWRS
jgi:O-succinylbenzoate synthase